MKERKIIFAVILSILATSCSGMELAQLFGQNPSPSPTPGISQTNQGNLQETETASAAPTETQTYTSNVITIWMPPQFDPSSDTESGNLFLARLQEFRDQNPGWEINLRIKAASGPGGLMDSLVNTSAAAPLALPSLIALPHDDLQNAAMKGLIYQLDSSNETMNDEDWYDYARSLAAVSGNYYGYPFAGDALVLVYRKDMIPNPPQTWEQILNSGQPVIFPAAAPDGLVTLNIYRSAGGTLYNENNQLTLDKDIFIKVLNIYNEGVQNGVFPAWLAQYENADQVWQTFLDQQSAWVITSITTYLAQDPARFSASPIPSLDNGPYSLAKGWAWAVADPIPERREISYKLAAFLTDPQFLAYWTASADFLPVRPSSNYLITDPANRLLLGRVARFAEISPLMNQAVIMGSYLQKATLQVIQLHIDPSTIASDIIDEINLTH